MINIKKDNGEKLCFGKLFTSFTLLLSQSLTNSGFIFSFDIRKKWLVGFELFDKKSKNIPVDLWSNQIIVEIKLFLKPM